MEAKSSSQTGAFFYPMFANWARVKYDKGSRLAKMAKKAEKPKIATIAKIAKMAKMTKISENARMAEIVTVAITAKITNFAKIAETEIVMLLKTSKIGSILKKIDGFLKKTWILFKIAKVGKIAVKS